MTCHPDCSRSAAAINAIGASTDSSAHPTADRDRIMGSMSRMARISAAGWLTVAGMPKNSVSAASAWITTPGSTPKRGVA